MEKSIKFLKIFFFLTIVLLFPFKAKSEISLSVSPQKLDLVLFAGESYQGKFKVTNHSQVAIPISVKAVPFGAKEGTGEIEFEKIEKDSPVFWFSFEKKEMILEPGGTERINFKIEVPKDTHPGGYYVFVYFEPRFPKEYFDQPGPKVIPIIGVPVLISTSEILLEPEKGKEVEVLSLSIPKKERVKFLENSLNFAYQKANLSLAFFGLVEAKTPTPEILITKKIPNSFLVQIKNNDIYHLKPYGKISIFDLFGKKIGEGELKGETILPGKTRSFEIKLSQKENFSFGQFLSFILFGKTKAKLEIQAQSPVRGEILLPKSDFSLTFFSLHPFYFLPFFVIIIFISPLIKRRIILALKVLIKKK